MFPDETDKLFQAARCVKKFLKESPWYWATQSDPHAGPAPVLLLLVGRSAHAGSPCRGNDKLLVGNGLAGRKVKVNQQATHPTKNASLFYFAPGGGRGSQCPPGTARTYPRVAYVGEKKICCCPGIPSLQARDPLHRLKESRWTEEIYYCHFLEEYFAAPFTARQGSVCIRRLPVLQTDSQFGLNEFWRRKWRSLSVNLRPYANQVPVS
jgi:hypothetical protein